MSPEPADGGSGSGDAPEGDGAFDGPAPLHPESWKRADARLELLRGATPGELLDRLVEGDPLRLAPRVGAILSQQAWLVDPERAWLRSVARIAFEACFYDGRPALEQWLDGRIQRALAELVEDQDAEELRGDPVELSNDVEFYARFGETCRLEPTLARLACWILNRHPLADRRIFHAVALERRSFEQASAAGLGSLEVVQRTFRRVTMALAMAFEERRRRFGLPPDPADPWPEPPHAS
jgi:hypothetical protein